MQYTFRPVNCRRRAVFKNREYVGDVYKIGHWKGGIAWGGKPGSWYLENTDLAVIYLGTTYRQMLKNLKKFTRG